MKRVKTFMSLLLITSGNSMLWAYTSDELIRFAQSGNLEKHIIALQENMQLSPQSIVYRNRHAYRRDAANNAAEYLFEQFKRLDDVQVEYERFGNMCNVVATLEKKGGYSSDKIILICAHYDSKASTEKDWDWLTSQAPGADDNATGVAVMLEAARILRWNNHAHTIRFVALDGEEVGLQGSKYHASQANSHAENIVAIINVDMVGYNWQFDIVDVFADVNSAWIANYMDIASFGYQIGLNVRNIIDGSIDYGDQKSFWDENYNAVMIVENAIPWRDSDCYKANPFFHTCRDTFDKVNINLVYKVTKLIIAVANDLAQSTSWLPIVPIYWGAIKAH